jgi:malyl-CoA/(S)-citramalyl-CoA lyase
MSDHGTAARRSRPHRSELAVPATSPHFFEKAARSAADVIFIDLEDAVAPKMKSAARAKAVEALNQVDWGTKTMAVRINSLDTEWAHRDIIDVVGACPRLDLVLVPKVDTAFDIRFVEQLVSGLEKEHRREKTIGIEALVETALGMANVESIAASSERLEALIFGVGDYSITMQTFDQDFGAPNPNYAVLADVDGSGKRERHWNDQWHFALARMANACRAYGLRPIDGPYANFSDPEGYRSAALRGSALGCEGKWAIHPSQIALANDVFTPRESQVVWAKRVLEAIAQANADGRGALALDGTLIDMAHEKIAQTILQRMSRLDGRVPSPTP